MMGRFISLAGFQQRIEESVAYLIAKTGLILLVPYGFIWMTCGQGMQSTSIHPSVVQTAIFYIIILFSS